MSFPKTFPRLILDTYLGTHNVLFEFLLVFPYSKNFKLACCLEGFHLQIALNLLKYVLFCSYCTHNLLFQSINQKIKKADVFSKLGN